MDRGNRKSIEGKVDGRSETTVEKTEARNEEAGWAARTPDIESEERNAEIGINGDAERKPGCAGKDEAEKQGREIEQLTETETREKTENPKRSHKSGERSTDDYGDPVMNSRKTVAKPWRH